jgi:hypothetical protein
LPLSSEKSREKGFRNGPGSTDPIPPETSLRDMSVHETEETPHTDFLDFVSGFDLMAIGLTTATI